MQITVENTLSNLVLGLVSCGPVSVAAASPLLSAELNTWCALREGPLDPEMERMRQACRTLLRNGAYKPTGRGKPASEYLLRAAVQKPFPQINGPVDANNVISLKYCVPISLWDAELANSNAYRFRLGATEEAYVFNSAGQRLELADLICGCVVRCDGTGIHSVPIVTPVKDSLETKLRAESRYLLGVIYFPQEVLDATRMLSICAELLSWLKTCGKDVQGDFQLIAPGMKASHLTL